MFGRTVSGFGSRAKRGAAPLALSIQENSDLNIVAPGPAGATVNTNAGEADVTAVASGGSAPYSYSWSVTEIADSGNCVVLAAGTQNAAQYNTLTFQTVVPSSGPPEANADYELSCTVTDSEGTSVAAQVNVAVLAVRI
tara:strand:+ start:632 stop:1048 length:417 start_codon:yes stop_codon:yes gene_type:complete